MEEVMIALEDAICALEFESPEASAEIEDLYDAILDESITPELCTDAVRQLVRDLRSKSRSKFLDELTTKLGMDL